MTTHELLCTPLTEIEKAELFDAAKLVRLPPVFLGMLRRLLYQTNGLEDARQAVQRIKKTTKKWEPQVLRDLNVLEKFLN